MIKNVWSVLCERIVIDKDTNLASYLTCIEEITGHQLPAKYPFLSLGSLWQTDEPKKDTLQFKLCLVSPDGSEQKLLETEEVVLEKERHRTNIVLNGIAFKVAGEYCFRVQQRSGGKWITVSEIPLKVNYKPGSDTA